MLSSHASMFLHMYSLWQTKTLHDVARSPGEAMSVIAHTPTPSAAVLRQNAVEVKAAARAAFGGMS